jgi:hypothetical protein
MEMSVDNIRFCEMAGGVTVQATVHLSRRFAKQLGHYLQAAEVRWD